MLLGGIWHGAGWTFVLWGALHAILIVINQLVREALPEGIPPFRANRPWLCRMMTFVLIVATWVPFRAADLDVVVAMYRGMLGLNGLSFPDSVYAVLLVHLPVVASLIPTNIGVMIPTALVFKWLPAMIVIAWFLPSTQEFMRHCRPGLPSPGYAATVAEEWGPSRLIWRMSRGFAVMFAIAFAICVLKLNDLSEFIYFQF